jgi:hypothetical protein
MRLGLSLKLEIRQTIDEANTQGIIRKRLSRPPEKIVVVLSAIGVTQRAWRKSNHELIASFRMLGSKGVLRIFVTKESKVFGMEPCNKRLSHQLFKGVENREVTPHDGVVRVKIDAHHDKTTWLHLQPVFKLMRILSGLISSVNRCLTLMLDQCYAQHNKVLCMA